MTREIKEIVKLIISAFFVALAITGVIYIFTFEEKMSEDFQNGYEQAILDAELVSINGNEYVISYNGEEHIYTK